MRPAAFLLLLPGLVTLLREARATDEVSGLYGDVIVIPCNDGAPVPDDLMFVKWKYDTDGDTVGDLLIKHPTAEQATVQATDEYAQRVSIDDNYSLLISRATLSDQKTFTCMVVSASNLLEYPVSVSVYKKPSSVQIMDKAAALQKDKATTVGTCVAADANPHATITWKKNGTLLVADGKAVLITSSMKLDPATGLSTTSSTLQYAASKQDSSSVFSCVSTHRQGDQETALEPIPVHYPSEKVTLQVTPSGPVVEGDNVTLKCHADGQPPPSAFFFHLKGQKLPVRDSDSYTVTDISREAGGEYKCSLADNEKLEASQSIAVSYMDVTLSPTGRVVKTLGDALPVTLDKRTSGDATVTWMKNGKEVEEPVFSELTYADSALYVCEVSMTGLVQRRSFELIVEGKPVITALTKHRPDDADYKVLTCEAEGVPEPTFQWSVNATDEKVSYTNGKATHQVHVVPKVNLTVTCRVSNKLGEDARTLNVSSIFTDQTEEKAVQDDSTVIVGVVVGLLAAAALMGLIYWLYMKNTRRGSFKTGEKMGTPDESRRLEDSLPAV